MYDKHKKNIKYTNITSFLILILVFSLTLCMITWGGGTSRLNNSAEALTSTTVNSAVKAGNGVELWDSSINRFNQIVLKDIIDKIFKQEDPVSFIKNNGKEDYEAYGKKAPSSENGIEYFVVPATVINKNVGNANYGMVIKLDDKWWMATSLTLTKSTNTADPGNVVLTLMLAEDAKKSVTWTTAATKDSLSYSSSGIRNHLITDNQWSLFNDCTTGSFANRFLVKPKDIQYQHVNTVVGRLSGSGNYHIPNCALGDFTSGWYSSDYEYLAETSYGGVKYNAWGEDYIWAPSYQEMGLNNHPSDKSCIWQLSSNQRYHTSSTNVLVRDLYVSSRSIVSKTSVGTNGSKDLLAGCVQPAIHLNLSAAMTSLTTEIDNPENMTTTYNDNAQTVKDLYDANSTVYPWYNAEFYEHTDNYINLTYQNSKGATVASAKDVDEYWVKAEITQAWIDAVNEEVDSEKTKWGWTAAQIATAKANRSPKFKGASVTEEGHVESDTVRWFKFTINPAELEIPTVAEASKTYTGSDIEFAISGYDSAKMTATPPDGYTLSNDGKISFKNANAYSINISIKDNNYCWKGTTSNPDRSAKTLNITVTRKDLSVQFKSSTTKFNMSVGENVTFSVDSTNVATGDTVELILTYLDGGTEKQSTDNTLNASGLPRGTYTLGVKLVDKAGTANSNYVIKNNPTQDFVIGSNKINIESVTWQYAQDGEPTEISGNSVVLTYNGKEFRFTVKETADELKAKGVKIDSYTNNVQKNATDGTVTVKVKLVPYDESFEFSDPTKTEVEFSLSVTINKIELSLSDFKWSAEPTNELEYTGNTQTVTIVSGLPSFLQVVYHGNSGLSVGPYTTTILSITVKNDADSVEMSKNYTSFEPEDYADYKYEWSITKKKIVANWTNAEHTTTNGKKITIPKVSGVEDGILEYSYTKFPSGEAITLAEILASYTETEISVYNVTVKIADGKTDSYMLLNSKNEVKDEVTQRFSVGDNKKAVTVSLIETKVYFNNQPQAVKLNYTGEGITMGDFAVEYKLINADGSEGEATNTAPTAVGKYKVTITLQGEKANTHIIIGENVFEYVIAHKDRFILTAAAAASHGYKFVYETFNEYEQDIKEYLYSAENAESVVYIAYLAFEDTVADLLKQFANAEDIRAYTADNTLIEDLATVLATGMMLRIMDGETILNQLTISVMGDIDGDGDIGTADKARLNSYTLDTLPLTGAYLLACDIDCDGEVGTADKARLNAYTLDTLDIYAGLTLRDTAQTSSVETLQTSSVKCDIAQASSAQTSFVERDTAQVTAISVLDEPAFEEAASIDEKATTNVTSAATEYVDDCEIANDGAMTDNVVLLLNDETTYIVITDIKNIAFATSNYIDCKKRM